MFNRVNVNLQKNVLKLPKVLSERYEKDMDWFLHRIIFFGYH